MGGGCIRRTDGGGTLRPSSNTVHQGATGSVTFTRALTSALGLVCRLGATSTDSPASYLLMLTDSLIRGAKHAFSQRQGDTLTLLRKINVSLFLL